MIRRADDVLAGDNPVPFFRAQIALWRDIARWSVSACADRPLELHPEVCGFIRWRARAELVLVRAWLTVAAWQQGERRWRQAAVWPDRAAPDNETAAVVRAADRSTARSRRAVARFFQWSSARDDRSCQLTQGLIVHQ